MILDKLKKYLFLIAGGISFLVGTIIFVAHIGDYYSVIYFFLILITISFLTLHFYFAKE